MSGTEPKHPNWGGSRGVVLVPDHVLAARPPFARQMTLRRLELGMSQMDLAKTSGVPQSSIGDYEVGVIKPGPRSKAKIEAILGELPPVREPAPPPPLTSEQLEQAKRQLGIE